MGYARQKQRQRNYHDGKMSIESYQKAAKRAEDNLLKLAHEFAAKRQKKFVKPEHPIARRRRLRAERMATIGK